MSLSDARITRIDCECGKRLDNIAVSHERPWVASIGSKARQRRTRDREIARWESMKPLGNGMWGGFGDDGEPQDPTEGKHTARENPFELRYRCAGCGRSWLFKDGKALSARANQLLDRDIRVVVAGVDT